MKIHEYQAKNLLKNYGIPVLKGALIESKDQIKQALDKVSDHSWIIKSQIHAGGRGKGGGIQLAQSKEDAQRHCENMLGMNLITPQTGPEGKTVQKLYIEETCDIQNEFYFACLIDRSKEKVCFITSLQGGVEIEEVAQNNPQSIKKIYIDPNLGFYPYHGRQIAFSLGLTGAAFKNMSLLAQGVYQLFMEKNASLIEINPLVLSKANELWALDAKINFDSNGLYKHPDLLSLRDTSEEDPAELKASQFGLNFIKLNGSIGCMVNGAGLAMATMDIIKLHGSEPANFLDVGGGVSTEKVTEAFKIILQDPQVKSILINIFGGIVRCDVIANGVVSACSELKLKVPLVVRLAGTNVDQGKKILSQSGLNISTAEDLTCAAQKAVDLAQKGL